MNSTLTREDDKLNKPIIVIGPGRSGSTVISEVIFSHESLAWPSNHVEWFPKTLAVNLIRPIFDNAFWRIDAEKAQLNKTRFMNTLLPYPAEAYSFWQEYTRSDIDFSRGFLLNETATEEEKERIRKAVNRIVTFQGKQRFAMKTTGPGRIEFLQSIFPDAMFVNVVRDPVSTVNSMLKVPFWQEQGMHQLWWRGAYSESEISLFEKIKDNPVAVTAFQLAKVLQTTSEEAERCGVLMKTVCYEDFIYDPQGIVDSLLEFLSLPASHNVQSKLEQTSFYNRNCTNRELNNSDERLILNIFRYMTCMGALS